MPEYRYLQHRIDHLREQWDMIMAPVLYVIIDGIKNLLWAIIDLIGTPVRLLIARLKKKAE